MYCKLSEGDRRKIRGLLWDGEPREDIAQTFGVCTRTIDREAAYWEAHTVTVSAKGGAACVRVGEAIQGDSNEIAAEAQRIASELMTSELMDQVREAEAEAQRIASECLKESGAEALKIDL